MSFLVEPQAADSEIDEIMVSVGWSIFIYKSARKETDCWQHRSYELDGESHAFI